MPGWYVHMEAAKQAADRLRAGAVGPEFPGGPAAAHVLGETAHTWRNYLAAGAIGPDIFFLLPDFKGNTGDVLLTVVNWVRETWDVLDEAFLTKWEKWAQPAIDGVGDVLDSMSGGTLSELSQALNELSAAVTDAFLGLMTKLYDWFGILSSGVPQAFGDSAFFWSDMFHYRKTFEFGRKLFENATTDQQRAFAIGWMSHCATDVTGHAFVNEKAGGPYRLHWQRHHLVENHIDAHVYDSQHGGTEPYGELDTAALHFRLAFRKGRVAPYVGALDAPAFDYFTGFPAYDTSNSAAGAAQRKHFFDLPTADLPEDLCQLIINTMRDVYGTDGPQILEWDPPEFRDGTSGRPSVKAIQNTFWLLYEYVKSTSTSGYSPRKPPAPNVLNDHSPPEFPGSDSGVSDDPARGGDPSDDSFNLLDLFLAIFAFAAYIAELAAWLATLPAAVLADILTYPAREILYEFAVVPMWNLYIAARKPLVLEGFLVPKHDEIERGLVELGIATESPLSSLAAALASPDGNATAPIAFDEKSGRASPASAWGADPAYPRAIVQDPKTVAQSILGMVLPDPSCGRPEAPSEFLRPWRYPEFDNSGDLIGWEAGLTHPGPWLQGQDARVLMNHAPGDAAARAAFEAAGDPAATADACDTNLPLGRHLGDPVDYSVYLVGRLAGQPASMPDFNLDADRGYAFHCWDWNRTWPIDPVVPKVTSDRGFDQTHYTYARPCTVPQGYCADVSAVWSGPAATYDPTLNLGVHYLEREDPHCAHIDRVSPRDEDQAGMPPAGREHQRG